MTISTSTATTNLSVWMSRVRLIRCPGIRMPLTFIEEMDGYQFRDATLTQKRPNSLEFGAVRQYLKHLDGGIRSRVRSFYDKLAVIQSRYDLLFHDTSLVKSFGRVLDNDVLVCI